MDFLRTLGEPAENIIAIVGVLGLIWAGIKFIPRGYRWVRSWTFVKSEELERLKTLEKNHKGCEEERLRSIEETAKGVRAALEKSREPVKVVTDYKILKY
jgi:hypothetical protein